MNDSGRPMGFLVRGLLEPQEPYYCTLGQNFVEAHEIKMKSEVVV